MMLFSRIIMSLLLPPASLILIIVAGFLLMKTGRRFAGRVLVALGVLLLYLLSTPVFSNVLIRPLESAHPPVGERVNDADAVVVLTGGARDLSHIGLLPVSGPSSLRRLAEGIMIYRASSGSVLVVSGGRADPARPWLSFAGTLGREAMALGVTENDLIIEEGSENTYEGALKLRETLKGRKKIVLVTAAYHMGRSVMLYRKAGIEVVPYPVDYIGQGIARHVSAVIPTAGDLGVSSTAIYEYLSRTWYWVKGFFVEG